MGQYKDFMSELTFTDGTADAKLFREKMHARPIKEEAWNYEKALKNLFMNLSESDHGSSATKTKFDTLVHIHLDGWNFSKEKMREDCAFLVAKALLHREDNEFKFVVNWRDLSVSEHSYIHSFCMELLLPEKDMRQIASGDSERMPYADLILYYGVTVNTLYARMIELDLL